MFPIKPTDGEVYAASNGTSYKYDSTRNAWKKTVDETASIIYQSLGIGTPSTIETSSFTGGNSVSVELSGSFNDPLLFNMALSETSLSSLVDSSDYTNSSSTVGTSLIGDYIAGSPDAVVLTNTSSVTTLHAEAYSISGGVTRTDLVGAIFGGVVTNYNSVSATDYDTTRNGGVFTVESSASTIDLMGSYSDTVTNEVTLSPMPVLPDSIDFARYSTHTVELTT